MLEERFRWVVASRRRDVDRLALTELVRFPAGVNKLLFERELREEIKEPLSCVAATRFDAEIEFRVQHC